MSENTKGQEATLERYREYVALLARLQVGPRLDGKIDLSGVVQQTLLEAFQNRDQMQGWEEARQTASVVPSSAHRSIGP